MKIKFLRAFNGDCIWISFLENGKSKNILIDGGIGDTYKSILKKTGELYSTIKYIKEKDQKIDLLILTHFDDDHIGGILRWFNQDREAYTIIEKVWFNSGKEIANKYGIEKNKDLKIKIVNTEGDFFTSAKQGINFEKYLSTNTNWDKKIIKQGDCIEELGIRFKILSPNEDKLKDLVKLFRRQKDYFTSGSNFDFKTPIKDFITEENNPAFIFKEDDSVPNGSSIAFLMEYKDKKFLFLGDSHPSIIIEGLNYFKINENDKINIDLMKVSHHGSKFNTSERLLKTINTNNYLISSNGSKHGLPNKRTISRIIKTNPNAQVHFNYEDLKSRIFLKEDFEDYVDFKISSTNEFEY